MDSTVTVQRNGFGFSFQAARNSLIAAMRSLTLKNESRRMRLLVSFGEPAFNQVEPTATGGHIVDNKARMLGEPDFDVPMSVSAVVVHYEM